jgi:hypothetical protein
LLDWTRSPYIAAYFAFEQQSNAERCAVYAYIESVSEIKLEGLRAPQIARMGANVKTHTRHFAQKADYTIATKYDVANNIVNFCPHESITRPEDHLQDVLIKITIPRSDRITALRDLEDYNINHYTLFGSEDGLARTLGLRAFELD